MDRSIFLRALWQDVVQDHIFRPIPIADISNSQSGLTGVNQITGLFMTMEDGGVVKDQPLVFSSLIHLDPRTFIALCRPALDLEIHLKSGAGSCPSNCLINILRRWRGWLDQTDGIDFPQTSPTVASYIIKIEYRNNLFLLRNCTRQCVSRPASIQDPDRVFSLTVLGFVLSVGN